MNLEMKDVEIFEAGTQTDSEGNTQEWTVDKLQQIADNFNAQNPDTVDAAPAVVGHPEEGTYPSETAPAYGWLHNVRVVGTKLVGDFRDAAEEFVQWVKDKRYSNRSISIDPNAMTIKHVGWLGAVLPAVKGLEAVAFKITKGAQVRVYNFVDAAGTPADTPAEGSPQPVASADRTARATQYKISIVPGQGYDNKPARLADLNDDQFADPVNYRFPLTEEFIDTSVRTWGKEYVQEQYTDNDRKAIGARLIVGMVQHGFQIPSYWCYKATATGSQFKFGNNFVEVPAEMLSKNQLVKVVNAIPAAPTATPPKQTTAPVNSPTNQEFADMITEQQILDVLQKLSDATTAGLPTDAAAMYAPWHQTAIDEVKALFAAEAAAPVTASEGTPEPAANPQFAEFQRKFNEQNAKIAALEADKRMNEHRTFAENAFKEGKILPPQKSLVIELREALHVNAPGSFNFSEPNGSKKSKPIVAAFDSLIESMQQINYSEGAPKDKARSTKGNDSGYSNVSEESALLNEQVLNFQADALAKGRAITYIDALEEVKKGLN